MEVIIIIIVIVVVSLLSAASKKRPDKNTDGTPARPTLSDIQRAFMMSGEMEAQQRAHEPRPSYPYHQPAVQRPAAPPPQTNLAPRMSETALGAKTESRYASIDLATFHTDSADAVEAPKKVVRHQKSTLKLFEDKNDFVRAVIYSEILTRKAHR